MFPNEFLHWWELKGRDVTVTIANIGSRDVRKQNPQTKKWEQVPSPVLEFEGKQKVLGINPTNAKQLAKLFGPRMPDWIGKQITLYPDMTVRGPEGAGGIRIRDAVTNAGEKKQ